MLEQQTLKLAIEGAPLVDGRKLTKGALSLYTDGPVAVRMPFRIALPWSDFAIGRAVELVRTGDDDTVEVVIEKDGDFDLSPYQLEFWASPFVCTQGDPKTYTSAVIRQIVIEPSGIATWGRDLMNYLKEKQNDQG